MLVSITVPSTHGPDSIHRTEHENRRDHVLRLFSSLFGGATALENATGAWVDSFGRLIVESVIVVQSYCNEAPEDELIAMAVDLCQEWAQQAVLLVIGADHYFVAPEG